VYGLEADGEVSLKDTDLKGKVALVVGSEGAGISKLVKKRCDQICYIPTHGKIGSLNASMAVVCSLYEIMRHSKKT